MKKIINPEFLQKVQREFGTTSPDSFSYFFAEGFLGEMKRKPVLRELYDSHETAIQQYAYYSSLESIYRRMPRGEVLADNFQETAKAIRLILTTDGSKFAQQLDIVFHDIELALGFLEAESNESR